MQSPHSRYQNSSKKGNSSPTQVNPHNLRLEKARGGISERYLTAQVGGRTYKEKSWKWSNSWSKGWIARHEAQTKNGFSEDVSSHDQHFTSTSWMEVLENLLPNCTPGLARLHSLVDPEQIALRPNILRVPRVIISDLCEVENPLNSIAAGDFKIRSISFPCAGFDVNENESSAISAVACWQEAFRDSSKTFRNLGGGEARWSMMGRRKEERVDPHRPILLHCLNSPQLKKNPRKTSPTTLKAWHPKLYRNAPGENLPKNTTQDQIRAF